ncbi:hypothetical protein ElyMa_004768300 [Elysia marginata]|uniref:Uncharacterized protein n=1 Tax=Elysia marginata TaxID=1093978 RepID=A0AAV4II58_9GAST|nr:hypothetical protein ElyMa_004768300 [Elysia marginata]
MRTFLVCLIVVTIIGLVLADDEHRKRGLKGFFKKLWKKTKTAAEWVGDNTVTGHAVKFSAGLVKKGIDKVKSVVKGKKKVQDSLAKGLSGF